MKPKWMRPEPVPDFAKPSRSVLVAYAALGIKSSGTDQAGPTEALQRWADSGPQPSEARFPSHMAVSGCIN